MLDAAARVGVEAELALVRAAGESIRDLSAYRIFTIWGKLGEVRRSMRRAFAYVRHNGSVWDDFRGYIPVLLLAIFPLDFLVYFSLLLTTVGGTLTYVTEEKVTILEPQAVVRSVAAPWYKIWKSSETVVETVMVPVTHTERVVHKPNPLMQLGISVGFAAALILGLLWILKRFWGWQVRRYERWGWLLFHRACRA